MTQTIIPPNEEHLEAFQSETNQKREAYKATLSPEDRARLEAIETAVGLLETAKVSFALFAASGDTDSEPEHAGGAYWQFNRFSYEADYKQRTIKTAPCFSRIVHRALSLFSLIAREGTFVIAGEGQQTVYYRGDTFSVPPKPNDS